MEGGGQPLSSSPSHRAHTQQLAIGLSRVIPAAMALHDPVSAVAWQEPPRTMLTSRPLQLQTFELVPFRQTATVLPPVTVMSRNGKWELATFSLLSRATSTTVAAVMARPKLVAGEVSHFLTCSVTSTSR